MHTTGKAFYIIKFIIFESIKYFIFKEGTPPSVGEEEQAVAPAEQSPPEKAVEMDGINPPSPPPNPTLLDYNQGIDFSSLYLCLLSPSQH